MTKTKNAAKNVAKKEPKKVKNAAKKMQIKKNALPQMARKNLAAKKVKNTKNHKKLLNLQSKQPNLLTYSIKNGFPFGKPFFIAF